MFKHLIHTLIGWQIKLSSETDWLVFLGSPGMSFETFSPSLSFGKIALMKSTTTYVTFKAERHVKLSKRGYFDDTEYCKEDILLRDYIECHKNCYIKRLNVRQFSFHFIHRLINLANLPA